MDPGRRSLLPVTLAERHTFDLLAVTPVAQPGWPKSVAAMERSRATDVSATSFPARFPA
jgi:hypothetical protein